MLFNDFFRSLDSYGLTESLFPFILIFTLLFAILSKVNIFGKDKKGINIVFAAIIALTTVILHVTDRYPPDKDPIAVMNDSLPVAAGLIIAIVGFLMLISTFEGKANLSGYEIGSWVVGLSILIFINFAFPTAPFWVALASAFIVVVVGSRKSTSHKGASAVVFLIIISIMYIFGSNAGYFEDLPYWMDDAVIQSIVVALLVFVAVVFFISRGEE